MKKNYNDLLFRHLSLIKKNANLVQELDKVRKETSDVKLKYRSELSKANKAHERTKKYFVISIILCSLILYGISVFSYNAGNAVNTVTAQFPDITQQQNSKKETNLCKSSRQKLLDILQPHIEQPDWSKYKNKTMPQPVWMTDTQYNEYLENFKFDKMLGNSYAHKKYQNFMFVIRNAK